MTPIGKNEFFQEPQEKFLISSFFDIFMFLFYDCLARVLSPSTSPSEELHVFGTERWLYCKWDIWNLMMSCSWKKKRESKRKAESFSCSSLSGSSLGWDLWLFNKLGDVVGVIPQYKIFAWSQITRCIWSF